MKPNCREMSGNQTERNIFFGTLDNRVAVVVVREKKRAETCQIKLFWTQREYVQLFTIRGATPGAVHD